MAYPPSSVQTADAPDLLPAGEGLALGLACRPEERQQVLIQDGPHALRFRRCRPTGWARSRTEALLAGAAAATGVVGLLTAVLQFRR